MNDQFEKFLQKAVAGSGQVSARLLYRMTVYHRPPRPTFTGDVLSRMRTSMQAIHEPITQAVGQAASAPAHPEEIRAKVRLRLGKRSRLNATLRTTPAGLVTAGIMTAAIFLSIAALVRAARRPLSADLRRL
jgi:hypothetical protein